MARLDDESRDRGADRDASHDSADEVRRRAYDRYVARGGAGGSDVDDWLEAEREVRARRTDAADRPASPAGDAGAESAGGMTAGGRGVADDAPRSADEARSGAAPTDSGTMSGMEGVVADERDAGTSAKTSRAPRTRSGRGRRAD